MTFYRGILACVLAVLAACVLLAWWWHVHVRPTPEYRLVPRDISVLKSRFPGPEGGVRPGLGDALRASLKFLNKRDPSFEFPLGAGRVTVARLKKSLESFASLVDKHLPPDDFFERFQDEFQLFEVVSPDNSFPVLVTGYFQPVIKARLTRDSFFTYPIYGVPGDLVRVSLRDFDPSLPEQTLWGRVDGHRLVPYPVRREIDSGDRFPHAPVLAYLPGLVDGLMLQIQGSGILDLGNGTRRFIHYAASNGRPYSSIGKWLVRQGVLNESDADWPGIKAWAEKHPDAFRQAAAHNPRYVFFRWEERGPIGSMGEILSPMVSVALDPGVYPLSGLFFLDVSPQVSSDGAGGGGFRGFVLNQDAGNAIKGPFRLDLYCGDGDKAGRLAGRLRNRARLFIILARQQKQP